MKLTQHIPGFVSGVEPRWAEGTIDAILATPWVASYLDAYSDGAFFWSDNGPHQTVLMVQGHLRRNGVLEWWVVGYLDAVPMTLPKWSAPASSTERGEASG